MNKMIKRLDNGDFEVLEVVSSNEPSSSHLSKYPEGVSEGDETSGHLSKDEINCSDIPELGDEFWDEAVCTNSLA
jgi:hypothetical protein